MDARASVTMPAHNAEATIVDAVSSALAQTVADFELIVVDDGSRQPVAEVLADLRDERIRIIRHDRNRGLAAARNTALGAARAPLLSHLDADDLWEPGYLEAMLPCFEDPAVGLAYPNVTTFGSGAPESLYIRDPERHPVQRIAELGKANPIPNFGTMRVSAMRQVGGYAPFLWGAVDYYMYLSLAAAGWRFAYVDRVLGHYRLSPGSMSNDWDSVQGDNLRVLRAFVLRHPLTPGPRRRLLGLAIRSVGIRVPGLRRARNAVRAWRHSRRGRRATATR